MAKAVISSRMRRETVGAAALAVLCACTVAAQTAKPQASIPAAQTPSTQRKPSAADSANPATPQINTHLLGAKELAQRPYSPVLPAPLFPSTPRKQSQFVVQYVYNYAQSTYSPPVNLPLVSRASAQRDTPEGTLTAFYSAMRAGDYEAWLQCWDPPSRKALEAMTKQQKNGPEYWRAIWRQLYANKRFLLVNRLETVNYIILDAQIEDPNKPASKQLDSQVFVAHEGKWWVSNEFSADGLVMNYDPAAPVNKVVKEYELAPSRELTGAAALSGEAQKDFLAHHANGASLTRTVE